MNADDVEREVHHEFRSCPEHAGAPERRSDGEAPLGGAEARFELPQLKEADGSVESFDDDGEGACMPTARCRCVQAMKRSNPSTVGGGGERNRVTSSLLMKAHSACASDG